MEQQLVAVFGMITGTVISLGFFYLVYKLIKLFVDRKSVKRLPDNVQNRLNELEQNHQYLEKRIRNLEAITTEEDFTPQIEAGKQEQKSESESEKGRKLQNTLRTRS